jgi:hypothetical protein
MSLESSADSGEPAALNDQERREERKRRRAERRRQRKPRVKNKTGRLNGKRRVKVVELTPREQQVSMRWRQ